MERFFGFKGGTPGSKLHGVMKYLGTQNGKSSKLELRAGFYQCVLEPRLGDGLEIGFQDRFEIGFA